MIWLAGPNNEYRPPILTFIYLFARRNYTTAVTGKAAKAFVTHAVKNAAAIAAKIGYNGLPPPQTKLNQAAAAQIVTAR